MYIYTSTTLHKSICNTRLYYRASKPFQSTSRGRPLAHRPCTPLPSSNPPVVLNDPAETTGSTDPNITTSETTAPPDTLLVLPLSEPVALESVDYAPTSDKGGLASPSSTVGDINLMQLAAFLLPTLAIWLIGPILSLIDTAVVGSQSAVELAALGPGTMLIDYTSYCLSFLAMATTNMLAIAFSKHDHHGATIIVSDALIISLLLGSVVGGVFYWGAPGMLHRIVGVESPLVGPAVAYVTTRALGFPFGLAIHTLQAFFLAAQYPYIPLLAATVAGVGNFLGDVFLVNVLGWGVTGAAAATVFAQVITAALLYRSLVAGPQQGPSLVQGWVMRIRWRLPTLRGFVKFCRYAGPVGGVLLAKTTTYGVLTSLASSLGQVASAAHHVTFSVFIFFAVFGDAVSQAAQTFLPAAVGRPRAAWSIARRLAVVGVVVGVLNAAGAAAVVLGVPGVFTNDHAVIARIAGIALAMGSALLVQLSSMATEGMLLAGRDLWFLLGTYVVNAGVVGTASWVMSGRMDGLLAVWLCITMFQANRLVVNWLRLWLSPRSPLNTRQQLTAVDLS